MERGAPRKDLKEKDRSQTGALGMSGKNALYRAVLGIPIRIKTESVLRGGFAFPSRIQLEKDLGVGKRQGITGCGSAFSILYSEANGLT